MKPQNYTKIYMKIDKLFLAIFATIFTSSCSVFYGEIEEPSYKLLKENANIEIRKYDPYIIAKVEVSGDKDESVNKGFRKLADYIFGNNIAKSEIRMTAPVSQTFKQQNSEKIAMTAPVNQTSKNGKNWEISFVMPSKFKDISDLPKPVNNEVKFNKVESAKKAVIRFSGLASESNFRENEQELVNFLNKNNYEYIGESSYHYYNPPWTPWFMKRNEVSFELK